MRAVCLFQLETLTVSAFDLSGICFVGSHLNGVQTTVLIILTVMGTVVHSAFDALVGGAGTAAVGAILRHNMILLHEKSLAFRRR